MKTQSELMAEIRYRLANIEQQLDEQGLASTVMPYIRKGVQKARKLAQGSINDPNPNIVRKGDIYSDLPKKQTSQFAPDQKEYTDMYQRGKKIGDTMAAHPGAIGAATAAGIGAASLADKLRKDTGASSGLKKVTNPPATRSIASPQPNLDAYVPDAPVSRTTQSSAKPTPNQAQIARKDYEVWRKTGQPMPRSSLSWFAKHDSKTYRDIMKVGSPKVKLPPIELQAQSQEQWPIEWENTPEFQDNYFRQNNANR